RPRTPPSRSRSARRPGPSWRVAACFLVVVELFLRELEAGEDQITADLQSLARLERDVVYVLMEVDGGFTRLERHVREKELLGQDARTALRHGDIVRHAIIRGFR